MLAVCWWAIERVYYRQYFWSNILGDLLGLPLISGFTMALLLHLPGQAIHAWYTSTWWYVGVLVLGMVIITLVTYREVRDDCFNPNQELSPSKLWHTLGWPVFFWVIAAPAPAAISMLSPHTAILMGGVLAGVMIWAATLIADLRRSPSPLGGVVEFSYRQLLEGKHPSYIRTDQWIQAGKRLPAAFFEHYTPAGAHKPPKA